MGLINHIQKGLHQFSRFQQKQTYLLIAILLLVTLFFGIGITKIVIESDFGKLDPKGLPVTDLDKKTGEIFGSTSGILILVQLDDEIESTDVPIDIRDPEIIDFLIRLKDRLEKEDFVVRTSSLGSIFSQTGTPEDIEGVKAVLKSIPGSEELLSRDNSFTIFFVSADLGSDTDSLDAANKRVDEVIKLSSPPPGIKAVVTGDPALGSALFRFLINDSFTVLIFATIFIFILLAILEFSVKRAIVIILPLLFGLSWTIGALGWLNIPITVGTAGLSAMLLGLGVEYSIFLYSRYKEERKTRNIDDSLDIAVTNIGSSIFSSGGTTAIGFFALSLSIFPILGGLGKSLGIGIIMLLAATISIGPLIVILDEKLTIFMFSKRTKQKRAELERTKIEKAPKRLEKIYGVYGGLVSKRPVLILIFAIGITVLMFSGMQIINDQDFNFRTVLPEDMPELQAFNTLEDEFGDTSNARVLIYLDTTYTNTDEPLDITDPRIINYVDMLTQKLKHVDHVIEVDSISNVVKSQNNGIIPNTIATQKGFFEMPPARSFLSDDFSATLIRVTTNEEGNADRVEVVRQINEIIDNTEKPAGIDTKAIGALPVIVEQDSLSSSDSSRTSIIALILIVVFIYLLTRSVKGTILPLLTVILGVIWTLGLIGFFQVPFTPITASVITITIGVGIDFGLQLMTRFQYELKFNERKEAMKRTITGVLNPMIITVIAAVIGFRAMGLGKLSMMNDLGSTMSLAIVASMLASVTGVAAIMLLLQRKNKIKSQ
jgi:predicted RND superfamily exporter protein